MISEISFLMFRINSRATAFAILIKSSTRFSRAICHSTVTLLDLVCSELMTALLKQGVYACPAFFVDTLRVIINGRQC